MSDNFCAEYKLDPIDVGDIGDVHDLEAASYPPDEAATLEKITYRCNYAKEFFQVLKKKADGSIIGFVNGTCVLERTIAHSSMAEHYPTGRTLVIHSVTVQSAERRKGIATSMLNLYLRKIFELKSVDRVLLLSKAYLLPFYLKCGFQFKGLSPVEHGQEHWYELGMNIAEHFGLDMWQVDAFTSSAFGGNPAAVVLVQKSDKWMQNVAMENNLAETSFLEKVSSNRFKLRWFTPLTEVDLCGHATLAAAHVLVSEGLVDPLQPIVFESKASGELVATSIGGSKLQLSFPATPPVSHEYNAEEMNYIKTAFGFADQDILYAGCTIYDKFFEVTSDAFSRISDIDFTWIGKFDCRGVIITSAGGKRQQTSNPRYKDYDITSRCFFPRCGINEDPVTGSAHCAIAPYWFEKFGQDNGSLVAFQASTRGGVLHLSLDNGRVNLVGDAVTTVKGKLFA